MNYKALDEALEYIEAMNEETTTIDGKKMLEELKNTGKTLGIVGLTAAALVLGTYGAFKIVDAIKERRNKKRRKEEEEKNKKKEEEWKNRQASITDEERKKMHEIEDDVVDAILKHLKDYNNKEIKPKYKDNISYKKCCKFSKWDEGGVEISTEQCGIAWTDWAKWEKENQDKMSNEELKSEGERLFGNKWYYDLLGEGEEFGKKYCNDKGYSHVTIDTGDGDEGIVYVEVYDV